MRTILRLCCAVPLLLLPALAQEDQVFDEKVKACQVAAEPCLHTPVAVYHPNPEYSAEARQKGIQGIALLSVVVRPDGSVSDVTVVRSLGFGLDEEAVKTVQGWKFTPATYEGHAVAVRVKVEVSFYLYGPGKRVTVGRSIPAGTLIKRKTPKYTREAKQNHITGTVVLSAVISKTGELKEIKVIKGLGYGLDESAVEAASQWKYAPLLIAGEPVEARTEIKVNFDGH